MALNYLTQAGVVAAGSRRLWLRGTWTEVTSHEYAILDEPDDLGVPAANDLYVDALEALHAGDGVAGEAALRAGLALVPDNPRMIHNLSFALDLQGRHEESRAA